MEETRTNFAEEFGTEAAEATTPDTTVPAEATPAAEKQTYQLADGSMGSRAAFIREKFLNENMSRKEIAEKFNLPYRVVYSATVNMTNTAEAPARGRQATATVIQLTADGKVVLHKDGKLLVDGAEFAGDEAELGELTDKSRNEWVQEQVNAGVSRGDIAKKLDMSYGVIYGLTKESEGTRQRIEMELDGKVVSRSEWIRAQFAAGKSRGDIAKELDVPYSVVWQATKTEKSDADKFAELVKEIKTFADKVMDTELFGQITGALDTIVIKEPEEAKSEEAAPTDEAPATFTE